MKGKELEFGELIIELKKEWETKNIVQGGSLGLTTTNIPVEPWISSRNLGDDDEMK